MIFFIMAGMVTAYFILLLRIKIQMYKAEKPTKFTKRDLKLILGLSIIVGVFFAISYIFKLKYDYKYSYMIFVGMLFLFSLFLHCKALRDLGRKNWSDSSRPREDSTLVTTGVYSIVRHPIYLSFFLEGVSVILASPYLIGIGICECSLCFYRINFSKEEKYLQDRYGTKYIKYKQKVKYRIIPLIY